MNESVITWNLRCKNGHRWFTPMRYMQFWSGQNCGRPMDGHNCVAELEEIPEDERQ